MKKSVRRATMAALLVSATSISAAALLASAHAAVPARTGPNARAAAQKQDPATTARAIIAAPINDAAKLLDMKDFAGATAKIMQADMVPMKTPYEEYMVAKYLGFVAVNQPMQNLAAATVAYNRQIASGGAPEAEKALMYNVAMRLNFQANDYPKVIQNAAEYQKFQPLDDVGYQIVMSAYFNMMDFDNTVGLGKKAVAAKAAAGMKPTPEVLSLMLNSQLKLKDEEGYRQTLDQLALISSQPDVWGQVMDFALSTKGITDHQLLNVYRLAIQVGTMVDADYAAMATIDLQSGLPAEAKAVLTKAGKTGELLTQANMLLATDQASLPALAAEADKQTNGEVDVKLGESYWAYGRFDEAVAAIQKGIQKGGLKDPADAQTTLGIALMSAGKKAEAAQAFDKAAAANATSANVPHAWALYARRAA